MARPNRASVRRPGSIVGSIGNINAFSEELGKEEDARAENATLVENLKKSLRNAELQAEDSQKQMEMMMKKMDDMMREHARVEENLHESTEKIEELEARKKEDSRQVREMANLYESERHAMMRDREEASNRETELKATIQRLKETMAGREMRILMATDPERRLSRQGTIHKTVFQVHQLTISFQGGPTSDLHPLMRMLSLPLLLPYKDEAPLFTAATPRAPLDS